jgi:predicted Zn-dependent peptidase
VSARWWAALGFLCACAMPAAGARLQPRVMKSVMGNGLVLIVKPSTASDIVAVHAFVRVPATVETEQGPGVRQLLSQMLVRGSTQRSGAGLAAAVEAAGGTLNVAFGLDYVDVRAVATGEGFDAIIDLLADVLRHPIFDAGELERQRAEALVRLDAVKEDAFQSAYFLTRGVLYGKHPYGLPNFGTAAGLRSLTRERLVGVYRTYFVPNNTVIAVAGAVSKARAYEAISRDFDSWQQASVPQAQPPQVQRLDHSRVEAVERPLRAASLMLAFPAPAVSDPDYPAVQVIDTLLGGGMASRLYVALRGQEGLAYDVRSLYPTLQHESHLAAYVTTAPGNLETVKRGIVREIERLQNEPVPEGDLERAKRFLTGSYALRHQRNSDQAFYLGWYEAVGVGWEFDESYAQRIAAVTAAQVQQAARTWLKAYAGAALMPQSERGDGSTGP